MGVVLEPVSDDAAAAILTDAPPPDVTVAPGYPSEFSKGIAQQVASGNRSPLGPFFIRRADDGVVVGEIGGAIVAPGVAEIGYAVVESCWGLGHATEAVRSLLDVAREVPGVERLIAHAPLERPASSRVLEKAGFTDAGEVEDEHEGAAIRVRRWEFPL